MAVTSFAFAFGVFALRYAQAVLDKERGRVAVKLVNIRETSSRTLLESFEREVDVLSRVKHQNVVKVSQRPEVPLLSLFLFSRTS